MCSVYIVGVGPGDLGLITVKALSIIKEADVVVYDRLIPPDLLGLTRPDAELVFAGKELGHHVMEQAEINELLLKRAREGKMVARLHGGDPFLFGRGFEECLELLRNGIKCTVIPGITSAIAAPERFLVPLVVRGIASSVAIVTGTEDPNKGKRFVNFKELAGKVDTIVVLMGRHRIKEIAEELVAGGLSPATPVAAISKAFMDGEKIVFTTLRDVNGDELESPVVFVIGNVVQAAASLSNVGKQSIPNRKDG